MAVEVRQRREGTVTVVSLVGDLDGASAPDVQERLRVAVPADGGLLVDLTGVAYMSSAGMRTMLLLHQQARSMNTRVALVGLNDDLRSMMTTTGFLNFFTVDESVAAGVRNLESTVRGAAS